MTFDPATLFAAGEQGAWFDPSDITTLFQDVAGTQPVTAAGQSVARINDKSGRGNHATQANLAQRPLYQIDSNGLPFLLFDGSDDGMATGNINPGAIDKAQVFAGVRKLSDAAFGTIVETSANFSTNNGTLSIGSSTVTGSAARRTWFSGLRGTSENQAGAAIYVAPDTRAMTALFDIAETTSAAQNAMRLNGVNQNLTYASGLSDAGTGNFLTYPLFIGRRGGASLPFNGRLYGLIVRFGANLSAATINAAELFMRGRTFGQTEGTVASTLPLAAAASGVPIAASHIASTLPLAAAAFGVTLAAGTVAATLPLIAATSGNTITAGAVAATLPLATQAAADILTTGDITAELRPETNASGDIITAGDIAATLPLNASAAGDIITLGAVEMTLDPAIDASGLVFVRPPPMTVFRVTREQTSFNVPREQTSFKVRSSR